MPGIRGEAGVVEVYGEQALTVTTPVYEDGLQLSITKVRARNFKSIRNLELALGPLTVLVGAECVRQEQRS